MFSFYNQSLALLTDFYELTMAYGYWKQGMAEDEAVFNLFFRKKPFEGGYAVAAGLATVIDYLNNWHFDISDLDFLATLEGKKGEPLFEEGFLNYLMTLKFTCDLDAVREGEIIFPYEPILRIQGPILQAQLLESALLNLINFPTLIATKASRMRLAAQNDPILEFGLRRAQGIDGSLTATRAAYIGGCTATSNTLGGKVFGIPVQGTHAHSWVMAFDSEKEAFKAFAEALPNQSVFLVDTYDTLQGVKHAIEIGEWLRQNKQPFLGIRLDSGDIAYLSVEARKLLDAAGFEETKIYASNELNEILIADLKAQGAQVTVWGIGTHLVTGQSQPSLDGVYKLSAFRKQGAKEWQYRLKISERMSKISDPGILQVRRFYTSQHGYVADALYDVSMGLSKDTWIIDPFDPIRKKHVTDEMVGRDLLIPLFRRGACVYPLPSIHEIREYAQQELQRFDKSIKRLHYPHSYPVGMDSSLYKLKLKLIEEIQNKHEP